MKALVAIAGSGAALVVSAWVYVSSVTAEDLLRANDMEEFNSYASIACVGGTKAIPMFLEVLDDSLKTKYSLFSYGKIIRQCPNSAVLRPKELATSVQCRC